jgi:hypothetical protein
VAQGDQLDDRSRVVSSFKRTATWWHVLGFLYGTAHYLIGTVSIILATTVASKPPFLGKNPDTFSNIAYLSALCTALLTFFTAKDSADRYIRAFHALQDEIELFEIDLARNYSHLEAARQRGDAIVGSRTGNTRRRK